MIYFVADSTSLDFAAKRVEMDYSRLGSIIRFVEYSQLFSQQALPPGTYIFSNTLAFGTSRRALAMLVEKAMLQHYGKFRILNSPLRSAQAREKFERLFPGEFLTKTKLAAQRSEMDLKNRFVVEEYSVGLDLDFDEVEDVEYLAEEILRGRPLDHYGLTKNLPMPSYSYVCGDNCLHLSEEGHALSAKTAGQFGLDIFVLTYVIEGGKELFTAIGDSLIDLLPSTGGETPQNKAITQMIQALDTIPAGEPIPLNLRWESMAKALRL